MKSLRLLSTDCIVRNISMPRRVGHHDSEFHKRKNPKQTFSKYRSWSDFATSEFTLTILEFSYRDLNSLQDSSWEDVHHLAMDSVYTNFRSWIRSTHTLTRWRPAPSLLLHRHSFPVPRLQPDTTLIQRLCVLKCGTRSSASYRSGSGSHGS